MTDQLSPRERKLLDEWTPLAPPADFAERVIDARAAVHRRRWIGALAVVTGVAAVVAVVASRPGEPSEIEEASPGVELPAPQPAPPPDDVSEVVVDFGDSVTVHDPAGTTKVVFDPLRCPGPGVHVETSRDAAFHSPVITNSSVILNAGLWYYRVSCDRGPGDVSAGRIVVLHDSGMRPLPKPAMVVPIDADGRLYRLDYQTRIPSVVVRRTQDESMHSVLHVSGNGRDQTFESPGTFHVPGDSLAEGKYTLWTEHGGEKSKDTTLIIRFDQTAAQVYIDSPREGDRIAGGVEVRGAVLPGWTVRVGSIAVPTSPKDGRFAAKLPRDFEGSPNLAIRFDHPQHGIHYYTRRLKN
ncbi:MAG TPA: hypothetical protein VMJ10_21740 [Kofleriaceae bacterium]|nr:hypothetical protein [Kofleriaceae bacterium]